MLPIALLTPCAAPLTAGPADEVTLERPCEVFEEAFETASLDLTVVSLAASVVDACRLVVWRTTKRVCRSIIRDGAAVNIYERWLGIRERAATLKYGLASAWSAFVKLHSVRKGQSILSRKLKSEATWRKPLDWRNSVKRVLLIISWR